MKFQPIQSRLKYVMVTNALKTAVAAASQQPRKFFSGLTEHMWILTPLIVTQLFQKLQDLIDDRLMNFLGTPALTIHNVQYSLYGLAQEIGLIAATSLLIFWKRKDMLSRQKTILTLHIGLTVILACIVATVVFFHSAEICNHFQVAEAYRGVAEDYIHIGLATLLFRALYVPINTVLIACNMRRLSIGLIFALVIFKSIFAWICSRYFWTGQETVALISKPMLIFAVGTVIFSFGILAYAIKRTYGLANGWGEMKLSHTLKVWPGEIGIGLVSAICPLLFTFQIAKANTEAGFFITYQIALHLTCLLTLPVLAGMQVATRDAAAEMSNLSSGGFKAIHHSKWWPPFFFASLVPTTLTLSIATLFPTQIIHTLYGYEVPASHIPFLPVFFASWIVFQWGSLFLIVLRASQKNHIATRNILVSGFLVQLGVTQSLLYYGVCTPRTIGFAFCASCCTFFVLNWTSVAKLYWMSQLQEKQKVLFRILSSFKKPELLSPVRYQPVRSRIVGMFKQKESIKR